nr:MULTISPECIES: hypothetical protein [Pseudomonas syringae group]
MPGLLAHDSQHARIEQRAFDTLCLDSRDIADLAEPLLQGGEQRGAAFEALDSESQRTQKNRCGTCNRIADQPRPRKLRVIRRIVAHDQPVDSWEACIGARFNTRGKQPLQPLAIVAADARAANCVLNVLCESAAQGVAEKIGKCCWHVLFPLNGPHRSLRRTRGRGKGNSLLR